jgi:hypothetical protein
MKLIQTLRIGRWSLRPRSNNNNQSVSLGSLKLTVTSALRSAAIVVTGAAMSLMLVPSQAQPANGPLVSWGKDYDGEVSGTPAGTFSAVAAGGFHSVGILTNGTLVSWGDDTVGEVSGTPSGTLSAVAAGYSHSVGLRTDGTLVSWGWSAFGLVSATPSGTFSAVAAGAFHSVGLRTDGTLVSWGDNLYGQVSGTPTGTFSAVAARTFQSVGLRTDGTLVSWGDNGFGQVSDTPSGTFSAVAAGTSHSVGLRTDGTLVSWGDDSFGQVSGTPSGTFSAVAAGTYHSVGLRTDGTLVSWGWDAFGQVSGTPTGTFSAVAAGWYHNVAIQSVDNAPHASCHNVIVFAGETCTANASIDNGSFSPDGGTITLSQSPAGPYPLGETLVTLTVVDSLGQSSSCQATVTVLDGTPPLITCPPNITATATSTAGATVSFPLPTASDTCSAFNVACSPASRSLFPLGPTLVTCTATDAAGNQSQCNFKVNVAYSWSGVLQPINADGSSVFKAGSIVSVKFQLTGASAGIKNAVARLSYAKVSDSTPGPVNEAGAAGNATAGNLFQYDTVSGQYAFNWSTKGMTAGKYQLTIDLGDRVTRVIVVCLR